MRGCAPRSRERTDLVARRAAPSRGEPVATTEGALANRLDRPVDARRDHALGRAGADLTLVEYGSYACPYCRAANEEIAKLRDRFGDRLRYVFRQRPIAGSDLARRAAEVAESAPDEDAFWRAHVELMTRSQALTEDDLAAVVRDLGLAPGDAATAARARARVDADVDERAPERRARDADLLHQRPALRRRLGRELARRRDAGLARPPRALRRARLRELGAVDRPAAARRGDPGGGARQLAARARVPGVLGDAARAHLRRRRLPHAAAALDQRRAADPLLPGRRRSRSSASSRSGASRTRAPPPSRSPRRSAAWRVPAALYALVHPERARGSTAGACRWRPTPRSPSR